MDMKPLSPLLQLATALAAIFASGCSSKSPTRPSEEEMHSRAELRASRSVVHFYRCTDDRLIKAEFHGDGLSLRIKLSASTPAIELRAARQGALFRGPSATVEIRNRDLIVRTTAGVRICTRRATS
jgi:hypothetical protein